MVVLYAIQVLEVNEWLRFNWCDVWNGGVEARLQFRILINVKFLFYMMCDFNRYEANKNDYYDAVQSFLYEYRAEMKHLLFRLLLHLSV